MRLTFVLMSQKDLLFLCLTANSLLSVLSSHFPRCHFGCDSVLSSLLAAPGTDIASASRAGVARLKDGPPVSRLRAQSRRRFTSHFFYDRIRDPRSRRSRSTDQAIVEDDCLMHDYSVSKHHDNTTDIMRLD